MTNEGGTIDPNTFESELRTPRWYLDLAVCSVVVNGILLWVIWFSPFALPKLRNLIGAFLLICLAYTLSVFAGRVFKAQKWSTAVWVPFVGSALVPLIFIGRMLPGDIEYYYRFTPEPTLLTHLFKMYGSVLFLISIALTIVTIIPAFATRVLVWLFRRRFSKLA